eukprot:TRINITY_DN14747_c0_g1_i1.p1 TRINITY_DN14747_c0_g1~~TRINITY_DN14747_c0_g1_i1.p1  ORF type:complete len:618 (-),score=120.91 TRINITY_DN14747_c0_g1_i1:267-2120(-)
MAWDTAGLLLPPAVARALGEDKDQGPLFWKHGAQNLFALKPKHGTAPIHLTPLDKSVAGQQLLLMSGLRDGHDTWDARKSVAGPLHRSEPAVSLEPRPLLEGHAERRRHGRPAVRRGHNTAASASPAPARESQASRPLLHGSRSQSVEPQLQTLESRSQPVEPSSQGRLSPFESALNPNLVQTMKNKGLMFLDHNSAEPEAVCSDVLLPPTAVLKAQPPDLGKSCLGSAWRMKSSKLKPSAITADKIYSAPVIPGLPSGRRRGRKLRRPIASHAQNQPRPMELIPEDTPAIILDVPGDDTAVIEEVQPPQSEERSENIVSTTVVHQPRPPSEPAPDKKPPRRPSRISPAPPEDLRAAIGSPSSMMTAEDAVSVADCVEASEALSVMTMEDAMSVGEWAVGKEAADISLDIVTDALALPDASRAPSSVLTMEDAVSIRDWALTMEAADVSQDVLSGAFAAPVVSKAPSSVMTMEDAAFDGEYAVDMQAVDFCEEIWDGAFAAQVARSSLASPAPSTWSVCTVRDLVPSELGEAIDSVGNDILNTVFASFEAEFATVPADRFGERPQLERTAAEKEAELLAADTAKHALNSGLCLFTAEAGFALPCIDMDFDGDDDDNG